MSSAEQRRDFLRKLNETAGKSRPLAKDGSTKANAARSLAWALFDDADKILSLLYPDETVEEKTRRT